MNIAEILGISSVSDVNVTNQTENVENTNEDFASYLNASTTTMDDIFNKASETYNVPVALLKAIAKQESNFAFECHFFERRTGCDATHACHGCVLRCNQCL